MSTILIVAAGVVVLIALWIWLSVKIGNKFGGRPQSAADQISVATNGRYHRRRLLNGEEYQLFRHLEPWMKRQRGGYRLFAQVSLGEIIGADDPLEYACVNSKRCDFVVIDPNGYPALAIEYQGSGHYTANADERDTVKRLALEGAGVPVVEVLEHYYWPEVLDDIETALGLRKPA